jgi:hypothetical protein
MISFENSIVTQFVKEEPVFVWNPTLKRGNTTVLNMKFNDPIRVKKKEDT